jgi:hypothetical protein
MKFIRDIISEKRGLSSASAPIPPFAPAINPAPGPAVPPPIPQAVLPVALAPVDAAPPDLALPPTAAPRTAVSSPDFVANLFPESEDDIEGPQVSLFGLDLDDDEPAQQDQAFRTIRAAAATLAAEDVSLFAAEEDGTADAAPDPAPVVSPFAALRSAALAAPAAQPRLDEMPFVSAAPPAAPAEAGAPLAIEVPAPAAGRGTNRSGRVKTRLLGFDAESAGLANPFEKPASRAGDPFPVGWLVVVAGPGRGASFALHDGVSRIGRGEDQTVCLNFGDNSISRENHVSIAYDSELSAFFIGQSGRSNIVRLNNKPLLSTEQIRSGDQIRVGETTLRLAALCGEEFNWTAKA